MKSLTTPKYLLTYIAVAVILAGCGQNQPVNLGGERVIDPTQRIEDYIRLIFKPYKREQAYDYLTTPGRNAIPLKDFKSLLSDELSDIVAWRSSSEIELKITHLKDFTITDDHHIIYSLVQVSFPYDSGVSDKFRLTRFHAYRERDVWYVEPFIHKATYTKRLLPSIAAGSEWELDDQRPQFYEMIGKDLLEERKRLGHTEEVAVEEEEEIEGIQKVGTLVIPDLRSEDPETVEVTEKPDEEKKVEPDTKSEEQIRIESYLTVGQLYFKTGNIPAAEESFRKVLELDSSNEVAKNYLQRCADFRRLSEEKEEQIKLIEKLLELEEMEKDLQDEEKNE